MEDLIIEQHPDYENLNQKLLKESEGVIYDWSDITYIKGKMSEWHICGKYIDVIKEEFEKLGYKVIFKVFKTHEYGIPQKRERLIILGIKKI